MMFWVELSIAVWAAVSVALMNRGIKCGLYLGASCNLTVLGWWYYTGQFGFLLGDLIFTIMFSNEIYHRVISNN